jgi:hypothetical protein
MRRPASRIIAAMTAVRLREIVGRWADKLRAQDYAAIEAALAGVAEALTRLDASQLLPGELHDEFAAMVTLYRAVRDANAAGQRLGRGTEIADGVVGLYYALRSAQASLSMRYAVAGPAARPPELSPVGTAIGLFDAPKILAQETHLRSGSYDADLAWFARWMVEIWMDLGVREADYIRFYGAPDTEAARLALRRILSLNERGEARVLALDATAPGGPASLRDRLVRFATHGNDIVAAAHAIEEAGQQARLTCISLLAHPERYRAAMDPGAVEVAEHVLAEVINWPYPVGETPLFDLDAEQAAFDALLAEVPPDLAALRHPAQGWEIRAVNALSHACTVEQSLRDHPEAYRARRPRSLRWYVWEFLALAQQAGAAGLLGGHGRGTATPPSPDWGEGM